MKSPDAVFRELGQLYDFYREIAKFRPVEQEGKHPPCSPETLEAKLVRRDADTVTHSK